METRDPVAKAVSIACAVHYGQKDKGGAPYILHPLRVMAAMDDDQARIVAVLHDAVEDSDSYPITAIRETFGDCVADAIDALTKRPLEDYDQYLDRVAGDEIARIVKLADLEDNSNLKRLGREPNDADKARVLKYGRAIAFLSARPATGGRE